MSGTHWVTWQVVSVRVGDEVCGHEGLTFKQFLVILESNTGYWVDAMVIEFV